jgi:hypothetical protein
MIKNYRIAAVICQCGLTEHQLNELKQTLAETSKLVEGLTLYVPGFVKSEAHTSIDPGIKHIVHKLREDVQLLVGEFNEEPNAQQVWAWVRDCDEVIGFPSKMGTRLKANRVWSLYRMINEQQLRPAMKIVGPWATTNTGTSVGVGKRGSSK